MYPKLGYIVHSLNKKHMSVIHTEMFSLYIKIINPYKLSTVYMQLTSYIYN